MGLPILIQLPCQSIIAELNVTPIFLTLLCVLLVMDIVLNISPLNPRLTRSLMDLFSNGQTFHQTTIQKFLKI